MIRPLGWLALVGLMVLFGYAVHSGLGAQRTMTAHPAMRPVETSPKVALPGRIYVVQGGRLYRLQGGAFTELPAGPGAWSQPAATPDGRLVAVARQPLFSDLYLLDAGGRITGRLTHNQAMPVEANHWAFYPAVSADGSSILYSYDRKDPANAYRVDLSIFEQPLADGTDRAVPRSFPNHYTGGDVRPVALAGSALAYVKYGIGSDSQTFSQVWLQPGSGLPESPLTEAVDNCAAPAVAPDGTRIAVICTPAGESPKLEVGDLAGSSPVTLHAVLTDGTPGAPAWAPDGSGLLYLAPLVEGGPFQLWYLPLATGTPVAVSIDLNLDATSAPVWMGG